MSDMPVPETAGDTPVKSAPKQVSPKRPGDTRGHRGHPPKSPTNVRYVRPRSVPHRPRRTGGEGGVPESVSPYQGGHTGHHRPAQGQTNAAEESRW